MLSVVLKHQVRGLWLRRGKAQPRRTTLTRLRVSLMQSDTDVELAALAKAALSEVGSSLRIMETSTIHDVMTTLAACSLEQSWYSRAAVLSYLTLFRARHLFRLQPADDSALVQLVRHNPTGRLQHAR